MIKLLKNLFLLLFMNPRIIDDRLKVFSEDALARLAAQNTLNQFDEMINITEAKHIAFYGAIENKDTVNALQKSRTNSVDNIIAKFIALQQKNDDIIGGKYGRDSATFIEFFPLKLTEYVEVTKTTIGTLLNRMVVGLTTHVADLGVDMKNQMIAMQHDYNAARGEQLAKKGEAGAMRGDVKSKRLDLAMQWQDNLFDIAKLYKGQPERVTDFFRFNLLLSHTHVDNQGNVIDGELNFLIPRNSQKDSGIVFTPATRFEFMNPGTEPIGVILTTEDVDQIVTHILIIILPGELRQLTAAQIGAANCTHLRMINQSLTTDGQLTIDILN